MGRIPLPVKWPNLTILDILSCSIFMAKKVNSECSDRVIFLVVRNFTISKKFSPISIPGIAKIDFERSKKALNCSQLFDAFWGVKWTNF
jgi:hypothetical protein